MKKRIISLLLVFALCLSLCVAFAACGNKNKTEKSASDIKYISKANQEIGWLRVIGEYWKTYDGNAMAGFRVSDDGSWVGLVVIAKNEASVTYHYDYNGTVYQYSKGSVSYNGETFYYASGPFWRTVDVGNPFEISNSIYAAKYGSDEEFVKHMLEICDMSKLEIPTISTSEELKKLAGASGPYILTNDIDLGGATVEPIKGFKGSLDGGGHTIKNFKISGSNGNFGLFDELYGATVTNLTLEDVSVTATGTNGDVGGLVGVVKDNCVIKNVTVKGEVSAILMDNVGGIIGYVENSKVEGCINHAKVTGFEQVGGVAGQYGYQVASEDGVVENNSNYGEITGLSTSENGYVGGVFGRVNFWPGAYKDGPSNWLRTIMNCNNYGKVTGAGHNVGGVVGKYTTSRWSRGDTYVDVAFANCINEGEVVGAEFHVGGIIGDCGSCRSVMNCENKGKITATGYDVGGIVGSGTAGTVTMCKNSGEISGKAFVGGIMGWTKSVVTNCENNGDIYANGTRNECDFLGEENVTGVGGIVGVTAKYVSGSVNNGSIFSTGAGSCIGGIAGGMVASNGDVIEGNINNGYMNVTGQSNMVGGIVGKMHSYRPGKGEGNYSFSGKNTGNVTAGESWRVGGIIGYIASQADWSYQDRTYATVINCENSGIITGSYRVAGIVGTIWNYAKLDDIYWSTNKNTGKIVGDAETADLYLMAS